MAQGDEQETSVVVRQWSEASEFPDAIAWRLLDRAMAGEEQSVKNQVFEILDYLAVELDRGKFRGSRGYDVRSIRASIIQRLRDAELERLASKRRLIECAVAYVRVVPGLSPGSAHDQASQNDQQEPVEAEHVPTSEEAWQDLLLIWQVSHLRRYLWLERDWNRLRQQCFRLL
jgi:hypothetical protein